MKKTMKYWCITIVLLLSICNLRLIAQESKPRFRLNATFIDAKTSKSIKNIAVNVLPYNRKVFTDKNGQVILNMPQGEYTLVIDEYPFNKKELDILLRCDTSITVKLESPFYLHYLDEVEVIAKKPATETAAGIQYLGGQTMTTLPAMIGERDLLKALSLSAGISSSSEGAADLQVRGGLHGQNLFLLDCVPLYSTQHTYGMISAYNPSIVRTAVLYKSDFPAEYGGKISSVLNVTTVDADFTKTTGEAEIGILSTKGLLSIPVVKEKLAFSIAGRVSNYSLLNLLSVMDDTNIGLHFGDINASLVWKPTHKDKFKLTFFHNSDGTSIGQQDEQAKNNIDINIKNRQQSIGLNWQHVFSEKSENNMHIYADRYRFVYGLSTESQLNKSESTFYKLRSTISSIAFENKYRYNIYNNLNLNAGFSMKGYDFSPIAVTFTKSESASQKSTKQFEGNLYSQLDYNFSTAQNIHVGLRSSTIGNKDNFYSSLEPRLGYHGVFKHDFSLSASLSRMAQAIHRIANPGLGFPVELFTPSSRTLKPENSWIYSLGAAKDFSFSNLFFTVKVDLWYKQMLNIVEYKDGYDALTLLVFKQQFNNIHEVITQGKGTAYGLDFSTDFILKKLSITADYTLMRAENQFDELNNGKPFAASTDIRHTLSLTGKVKLSSVWSFSTTWQYNSGRPITLPEYVSISPHFDFETGKYDFESMEHHNLQNVMGERNNYRTRAFHKMDISFSKKSKAFKKYDSLLTIGVYNLYNRANPYLYYISTENNAAGSYPILKSLSLFPVLPAFSYMIKF